MTFKFFICFYSLVLLKYINGEVVCSEDELIRELKEDIEDNGKLDCLREMLGPDGKPIETPAIWNSDCSFESEPKSKYK